MADIVLDASVVLAVIKGEPGQLQARAALAEGLLSAVNLSEVAAKLSDEGADRGEIEAMLSLLPCQIAAFDQGQAITAGWLRAATKHKGLSLGDRACLALALCAGLPILTADRAWAELELGVDVRLIR